MCIDVLATTANLRADDHTAMAIVKLTVTDDDILRRTTCKGTLTALTTIVVAARLDGDTVVASIEVAVLDEHAVARFGVAAVTIGTIVVDVYATHSDVGRE